MVHAQRVVVQALGIEQLLLVEYLQLQNLSVQSQSNQCHVTKRSVKVIITNHIHLNSHHSLYVKSAKDSIN